MASLAFFTVTGTVNSVVVDYVDVDTHPDIKPVSAMVDFIPRLPRGSVIWSPGLTPPQGVMLPAIRARIDSDGILRTIVGGLGVELAANTPELGVDHLAPAEPDRHLGLVAVLQEPPDVPRLELKVVLVRLRAHLDFFDLDDRLLLASVLRPPALLVLELAEVHDPADRRRRFRRDLDQVELPLLRDPERLGDRQDTELLALRADDPDFPRPNALVDPEIPLQC